MTGCSPSNGAECSSAIVASLCFGYRTNCALRMPISKDHVHCLWIRKFASRTKPPASCGVHNDAVAPLERVPRVQERQFTLKACEVHACLLQLIGKDGVHAS